MCVSNNPPCRPPCLHPQIRETLTARGKAPREQVNRALQCCGALAAALRGLWAPHATSLLDAMVLTGPSEVCGDPGVCSVLHGVHVWRGLDALPGVCCGL